LERGRRGAGKARREQKVEVRIAGIVKGGDVICGS